MHTRDDTNVHKAGKVILHIHKAGTPCRNKTIINQVLQI